MKKYGLNELRKMYLDFFKSKDHFVRGSYSLVMGVPDRGSWLRA